MDAVITMQLRPKETKAGDLVELALVDDVVACTTVNGALLSRLALC